MQICILREISNLKAFKIV